MVGDYLQEFGIANRADFDNLLLGKLSDALTDEQKQHFVQNLLQEMRREGFIQPSGGKRGKGAKWELYNKTSKD